MATKSATTGASADSYIGSFISLISKSEIRYEGVLFHINPHPHESTIGLKNVRSFGTEGRKKDGPQVPPSGKVYEYIYFRGSDINDLQVLSSQPVQSTPPIPDDPAIIQSHYLHPASTSSSLPSAGAGPVTNFSPNAQLGLPSSTFQGSLSLYQPVGSIGSWGSSPLNANGNGHTMPMYWQGFNGPSGGLSHLQQQSLLQQPPGLVASPSGQQQMQHPIISASIPSGTFSFSEFSHPLLPPVSTGSLNSTSTSLPSSSLPLNLPVGHSSSLASNLLPNLMLNNETTALPTVAFSSNLLLMSPLTSSGLDMTSTIPPVSDKPKSAFGPPLPYQTMSQSTPSIVGTLSSNHIEASIPSLVTPGQILQSGPAKHSSSPSLQTAHKDIEVVQASTSEALSMDSKDALAPILPLPAPSAEKPSAAPLHSDQKTRGHERGKRNGRHGAPSHTQLTTRGHVQGRENGLNKTASHTHRSSRVYSQESGHVFNGARSNAHHSNTSHVWGRGNGLYEAALRPRYSNGGHAWGRGNGVSPAVSKFSEDFDFEAMNEKFNKDEVWGQLGKSSKAQSENKRDPNDSDGDDSKHKDEDGMPNFGTNPVYVKDDFFDSLSCDSLNRMPRRGRGKFSEQRRLDTETFGDFQRLRGGRGGWRGRSRSSNYGRGYGYAGRGEGRTLWSRVT